MSLKKTISSSSQETIFYIYLYKIHIHTLTRTKVEDSATKQKREKHVLVFKHSALNPLEASDLT